MSWIFNSRRHRGTIEQNPYVDFFIGQVKIAEIHMQSQNTKWRFYIRFMLSPYAYDVPKEQFESFSDALKYLHTRLNAPAHDGNTIP